MSEAAVTQRGTRAPGDDRTFAPADWPAPDARRRLQLALGALWLMDAILHPSRPCSPGRSATCWRLGGGQPGLGRAISGTPT